MLEEDCYMTAQYFNRQAASIFGLLPEKIAPSGRACSVYAYDENVLAGMRYYIYRQGEFSYILPIRHISLFLFDETYHVGILSIEAYNTDYPNLEDIKKINDYGRRLCLPYLPRDEKRQGYILCADEIGLVYMRNDAAAAQADNEQPDQEQAGDVQIDKAWVTDYRKLIKRWDKQSARDEFYRSPQFIYGLIFGRVRLNQGEINTEQQRTEDELIDPVINDRMYLLSLIKSERLSNMGKRVESIIQAGDDANLLKEQKQLYELAFVDPTEATCQNSHMRAKLLAEAIYNRWSDYGTLYAMTGSAFLCLTTLVNEDPNHIKDSVYRPFLTEYYLMTVLVLAQKLSISDFADSAAKKAQPASKQGLIGNSAVMDIIDLHEKFVSWYNQVYLLEITEQEQGVDLYNMLRRQLGIFAHMQNLREQLSDLYAVANVNQGSRLSGIAASFAVIAVLVDITLNATNFIAPGKELDQTWWGHYVTNDPWNLLIITFLLLWAGLGWRALKQYDLRPKDFFFGWVKNLGRHGWLKAVLAVVAVFVLVQVLLGQ